MRRASWLLLLAGLLGSPGWLSAQEARTITGQVTAAESRQAMAGVQVTVKGTTTGTLTDGRGNFSIEVPASAQTLVFTYVGYRTEERPIAGITGPVQVEMQVQAIGIEGIVVTALGVQREKRSLGYSVQDVTGEQIAEVPELNIVNALKGNVAGVHITDANTTGGSARIVIRGASSIAGNNQPLFIVDGVPIDNAAPRNTGYGGIDYGNAAQDIDPNNIESISVLKGPNAAALYGSRAQNGAVVITTKSGRGTEGTLGLSASVSMTAETPLRLPKYQNLYGQGIDGEFQWVDGEGGGVWDHVDESWGPRLDGRLIDQFTGPQQPWVPHPDNVRDFFETGRTLNANVAVSRAGENSNVRLSVTNTNVSGMFPGNDINRLGVAVKGGANLTDRLNAEASVNYINQTAENRSGTGYDEDNPMQQFIWFGRQVDMNALKNYRCTGDEVTPCQVGGQYNWNYNYHNNPYWEALVNGNEDRRDRVIGHVATGYQLTDWLNARAQLSRDWYRDYRKDWTHHYSLDDAGQGSFGETNIYRAETNGELLLHATRSIATGLRLDLTAGGNVRRNDVQNNSVSVSRLTVPGIYSLANAAVTPNPSDFRSKQEVRSLLGSLSLNYNGYLNVDVTGRNDWSSTLPEDNNSYFYPSVSTAFVFSDAFGLTSDLLSSGKVRASWTRVGNDASPYQLASVFSAQQGWGGIPMFAVPNDLPNADLKPEETTAWEVGTDLGFLNERLGFVLTYYDSRTKNQILGVQISRASGFTNQVLNAGEVRNYGLELLAIANPVRSGQFSWDMTVNWAKNNSQVRELYGDLQTLVLGSYWSLNIEARGPRKDDNGNIVEYYPYGTMFGNGYLRDAEGRLLLTAGGSPRVDPVRRVLGNYNPDWTAGIQNRFSYGPAELSVLVDGQMGGDVFSVTDWFGEYAGVLESSLRGRENDFCDPGIVVPGILPDGSVNGDGTNDVTICPESYFGRNFGIQEASIVDASYIKLREIRLGYTLPQSVVSRFGFSGGTIALIGRNLALWSEAENIDPETAFDASNVQGIEFGQHPTARSIGLSLSIRP
ncbi:MAG TPA: SusC/RagA family TonB-linked outer membrane protein [Longimicrobiales bacterium]